MSENKALLEDALGSERLRRIGALEGHLQQLIDQTEDAVTLEVHLRPLTPTEHLQLKATDDYRSGHWACAGFDGSDKVFCIDGVDREADGRAGSGTLFSPKFTRD